MFEKRTRTQLYADKMAFAKDELIPVNALDLIDELVKQEQLAIENKRLRERISWLEDRVKSQESQPQFYKTYDLKGNLE